MSLLSRFVESTLSGVQVQAEPLLEVLAHLVRDVLEAGCPTKRVRRSRRRSGVAPLTYLSTDTAIATVLSYVITPIARVPRPPLGGRALQEIVFAPSNSVALGGPGMLVRMAGTETMLFLARSQKDPLQPKLTEGNDLVHDNVFKVQHCLALPDPSAPDRIEDYRDHSSKL